MVMASNYLEQENNGFGPIGSKRKQRSHYAALTSTLGSLGVALALSFYIDGSSLHTSESRILGTFMGALSSLTSGEIVRRMFLYVEERYHVNQRYFGSRRAAFTSCISFSGNNAFMFVFWLFSTSVWLNSEAHNLSITEYLFFVLAFTFCLFTMDYLGVKMSDVEISTLCETQIKNVATGLAWNYYYGYLNLILPRLDRMISTAVQPDFHIGGMDMKDKLSSKKLFVVIPKNCYCYKTFEQADNRISVYSPMPIQYITRGSVQERPYKTMLYCVQADEEPLYVIMEYPTNLFSIYEMAKDSLANFTEEDLNKQVIDYYKTLKMILESNPLCYGKYELVLVSKLHNNLAEVIKDKIKKQI